LRGVAVCNVGNAIACMYSEYSGIQLNSKGNLLLFGMRMSATKDDHRVTWNMMWCTGVDKVVLESRAVV
jgi:hypothetical protein